MIWVKNWVAFVCFALVVAVTVGCAFGLPQSASAELPDATAAVLIDPGHGGEDGGTVAEDGTLEKNINLAISLHLRDMLMVWGFPVSMTRQTDISIHSPECTSTRGIKVSDMQNRLALYEQADTVIAIHQNHFSVEKYSGAQVFYSGNHAYSEQLAAAIQASVVAHLQPENTRQIKKATDGIYLLSHTQRPAVLVECGFLSNPAERQRLKSTAYQQAMAAAVLVGFLDYQNTKYQG